MACRLSFQITDDGRVFPGAIDVVVVLIQDTAILVLHLDDRTCQIGSPLAVTHGIEILESDVAGKRMHLRRMSETPAAHQIEIMVQIGKIVFSGDDIVNKAVVQIQAVRFDDMLALVNQIGDDTATDIPAVTLSLQQITLEIHPEEHRGVVAARLVPDITDCLVIRAYDAAVIINKTTVDLCLSTVIGIKMVVLASPFKGVNRDFKLMALGNGEVVVEFIQAKDAVVGNGLKVREIVERAGVVVGTVGHQRIHFP